jgi:predicted Zn-dependent peptidase
MIFLDTDFKTIQIAFHSIAKDDVHDRVYRFLLPKTLSSQTPSHPSRQAMQEVLEHLYGAYVKTRSTLYGDIHVNTFTLVFPNPSIVKDPGLFRSSLGLLNEIVTQKTPSIEAFDLEKRLLMEQWETLKEQKRSYAGIRFSARFYEGDPYSVPVTGTQEDLINATYGKLSETLQDLMRKSTVFVVANGHLDAQWKTMIQDTFQSRETGLPTPKLGFRDPRETPAKIIEKTVMKQAILKVGHILQIFRGDPLHDAAIVYDTVLGGYPDSILFTDVREKQGLCYDISSAYDPHKGTLVISAGVDRNRSDVALDSIARIVSDLKRERLSEESVENAKRALVHQLRTLPESQSAMSARALNQALFKTNGTIEERIVRIMSVTPDDVFDVARMVAHDMTYVLTGDD